MNDKNNDTIVDWLTLGVTAFIGVISVFNWGEIKDIKLNEYRLKHDINIAYYKEFLVAKKNKDGEELSLLKEMLKDLQNYSNSNNTTESFLTILIKKINIELSSTEAQNYYLEGGNTVIREGDPTKTDIGIYVCPEEIKEKHTDIVINQIDKALKGLETGKITVRPWKYNPRNLTYEQIKGRLSIIYDGDLKGEENVATKEIAPRLTPIFNLKDINIGKDI